MNVEHSSYLVGSIASVTAKALYSHKSAHNLHQICSIVDKSVDKLWIRLWTSCGQLGVRDCLWKAVDKSASYPQEKPTYPHFHPQAVSLNHRTNLSYPHYPQALLYIGVQSKSGYVPTTERI